MFFWFTSFLPSQEFVQFISSKAYLYEFNLIQICMSFQKGYSTYIANKVHLEPTLNHGHLYLESVFQILLQIDSTPKERSLSPRI